MAKPTGSQRDGPVVGGGVGRVFGKVCVSSN